jgi:hypothetical protein
VAHVRARVDALPGDLDALAEKVLKKSKELERTDAQDAQRQKMVLQGLMAQA